MSSRRSPALESVFGGKVAWLSGHTGFKGAWLSQWLLAMGAEVHGLALPPEGARSLYRQLGLEGTVRSVLADVRDGIAVARSVHQAQPDFVFHLAAQPLVRLSYERPAETYAVNVMGTVHVLEALRTLNKPCAAVFITTDKCYENREWLYGYREVDPVGGHDPYSSSKAAAEIAISSWRSSFFQNHAVRIASARAGNVIGGGDWAPDRIVPDCVRALETSQPIQVRNVTATRPWQHVLEPLSGYLWLAAVLRHPELCPFHRSLYDSAFNFGPGLESNRSVGGLVEEVLKHWPGEWRNCSDPNAVHEANLLNLATDKAHHLLGWRPTWGFARTVKATMEWYRGATGSDADGNPARDLARASREQIRAYVQDAADAGVAWAMPTSTELR